MDFPPEWVVLPAEDFTTAAPRNPGICGMELLAQIRPNGRILDHFCVSLDGSKILEVNTPLSSLMPSTPDSGLIFKFAVAPRHRDEEEHDYKPVDGHHRASGF